MLETLTEPKPLSMEQRFGLGNQQESSRSESDQRKYDLYYLAGLFDGEGYMGVTINRKKRGSDQYYPRASVVNTNPVIIDKVCQVLTDNGVAFHRCQWDAGLNEQKIRFTVDMTGFRRCFRFAYLIEPYLVAKRLQTQLVLAFLWSRLKHGKSYTHNTYSEDEIKLYLAAKELNAKGREILREHTLGVADFATKMCAELRSKGVEATETMARLDRREGWSRS